MRKERERDRERTVKRDREREGETEGERSVGRISCLVSFTVPGSAL